MCIRDRESTVRVGKVFGIKINVGSKTRTIKNKEQRYLKSFEVWLWKRMIEVEWTDRVRNNEVLTRTEEETKLLKVIRKRKTSCLERILSRNCIESRIIEEKVKGRGGRGRRKIGSVMTPETEGATDSDNTCIRPRKMKSI